MCKLRQIFKNLLLSIILLTSASVFAQEDKLLRAQQWTKTNPEAARLAIDSVIVHPQTQTDYMSWTIRAYIYFELYKKADKFKFNSTLRDTILSSIRISNSLKPDSSFLENNRKLIKNLALGYYNIAVKQLEDSTNYEHSIEAFNKYKELYLQVDPNANFSSKELEFYNAVGGTYSEFFNKDNNNVKAGDIAKIALLKVLEIDPEDPLANTNMGLMYYNQAVYLSKSLDFGADFTQIDIVQENMIKLAKQSEQFFLRAYNKDNNKTKPIQALYYVYRMLNENAKSDEFKKLAMEKGVKFDDSELKEGDNEQKKDK